MSDTSEGSYQRYMQNHAKAAYEMLRKYGRTHADQDLVNAQVEVNRAVWAMNCRRDRGGRSG